MARYFYAYTHVSHFGGSREDRCWRDANAHHEQSRWALTALVLAIALVSSAPAWAHQGQLAARLCEPSGKMSIARFRSVMQTVAEGWNRGDAKLAASCFADNAIYSGPPAAPHRGRKALYEYFGGAAGRELAMDMTWHNLIFDPAQQIGMGEYTFGYRKRTHGMVVVKFKNGLIRNWREYEVESELPWDQFIGDNRF